MPIFEYLGILFEWHDPKFELVNSERGYTLEEIANQNWLPRRRNPLL